MTLEEIKNAALGQWQSIAPEVRPSQSKNENGSAKAFYLTRKFSYLPNDKFELEILNFADPFGKVPLVKMSLKGNMTWHGVHPIAVSAQKVDFIADEDYQVTPLIQGFVDILNSVAADGFNKWEVGVSQNILAKKFIPFGLAEGQIFGEKDLIYLNHGLMFWGARNVDGRGFDTEENRPTNLQIPMERV